MGWLVVAYVVGVVLTAAAFLLFARLTPASIRADMTPEGAEAHGGYMAVWSVCWPAFWPLRTLTRVLS